MFNFLNDYDLYLTFIAVAESDTLLEAAKKLQTSQATVSLRLRKLQKLFNIPIIEKRGRKIVVLESGQQLKTTVKESLNQFQQRLSAFQLQRNEEPIRPVRIGARQEVFLKLGATFDAGVPLQLIAMGSAATKSALLKSEVDVAVSHFRPESSEFIAKPLFLDSFVLCCPRKRAKGFAWPPKSGKEIEKLFSSVPALLYHVDSALLRDFARAYRADPTLVRPAVVCEDWSVLRNFLRQGIGFGILPRTFAKDLDSTILRVEIRPEVLKPLQFYYVYKREFRNSPQIQSLGAELKRALG